jgi:hypothetical protein
MYNASTCTPHLSQLRLEGSQRLSEVIMLDLVSCGHLLLVRSQALVHVIHLAHLAGQKLAVIQLRSVQHLQESTPTTRCVVVY